MNSPAPVATFVIGAMLSASVLCGSVDAASAGQIAVSSNAAAETVAIPPPANPPATEPHGRAYLFRGALGPIFSRGMDGLAEKIERAGVTASVDLATLTAGKTRELPYSFRYFTSIEQPVTLPADFKAERVTIEIRPARKSVAPYRQTFVWNPDAT